jgi:hypothetical protein
MGQRQMAGPGASAQTAAMRRIANRTCPSVGAENSIEADDQSAVRSRALPARKWLAVGIALTLAGCHTSAPAADQAASHGMNPAEARAFMTEIQAKRGVPPAKRATVTSMEELVSILSRDDVERFEDAARFVEGRPGIDALTLHATIELAWSDALLTAASVAEEFGKRATLEADRLRKKRNSSREFTPADENALEQVGKEALMLTTTREALLVLAKDHLQAASIPVSEALRQFERDPRSHRVAAFYHLLRADWMKYDDAMAWFERQQVPPDAGILYLRAIESWRRYGVRSDARTFLEQALEQDPKMVRAQAKLALMGEEIADLQKLQTMAPSHIIMSIAGPTIWREHEIAMSLARARTTEPPLQPKTK